MTKQFGLGLLALTIPASLAFAHGDEDKKGDKNPLFQGGSWSAKPGSGITYDGGDGFMLNIKNQLQLKYQYSSNEFAPNVNTFSVRRARTAFSGHVFNKNITFMVKNDWSEDGSATTNGSMKDVWVQWAFMSDEQSTISVRLGQGKTGFGRGASSSSANLEQIERDSATLAFANRRATGAMVQGAHNDDKLNWSAGLFNNGTASAFEFAGSEEAANDDNELAFIATVRFDPMGDMNGGMGNEAYSQADLDNTEEMRVSIGAGLELGNSRDGPDPDDNDVESTNININGAWKYKGWHAMGDVYLRTDEHQGGDPDEDSTGYSVQGSYTMEENANSKVRWGFSGRVTGISLDGDGTGTNENGLTGTALGDFSGDIMEVTLGVNAFYKGHNMKTQLNYTFQTIDPDGLGDVDNHIVEIMFTLIF